MNPWTNIFAEINSGEAAYIIMNSLLCGFLGYSFVKIVFGLFPKLSSNVKYYFAYLILAIVTLFTFYPEPIYLFGQHDTGKNFNELIIVTNSNPGIISNLFDALNIQYLFSFITRFNNFLIKNTVTVLAVWAMGISFFSIRYLYSLKLVGNIKNEYKSVKSDKFREIKSRLIKKSGLKRIPIFGESSLITSPSVIGFLKPIILLPAGLLTSLPADQIEMIIAHEIAHIKRLDSLFKFLQSLVEIFFFFNPFVWAISGIIDSEREKSCDDFALKIVNNPIALSKAIQAMSEFALNNKLVLQFSGTGNHFYSRIERIIKPDIESLDKIRSALAGLLFSFLISTIILAQIVKYDKSIMAVQPDGYKASLESVTDSEELFELLELKFGSENYNFESDEITNSRIDDNFESEYEDEFESFDAGKLEEKLDRLLGYESNFENTFKNVQENISSVKKSVSPVKIRTEISSVSELNSILAKSGFNININIDNMKELEKELEALKVSLDNFSVSLTNNR